jgi:phosphoribosyl-dephospho-CoA transferase
MTALRRHTLVWLSQVPDAETDVDRERATRWQTTHRPFVVTRRRSEGRDVGLGFCTTDERHPQLRPRRVAAQIDARHVVDNARPPSLEAIARCPAAERHAHSFLLLMAAAAQAHLDIRVYGSWMWQALTGEQHVHESSDLDVVIDVAGTDAADRASAFLDREETNLAFKIDGELSFVGLGEVSWREYRQGAPEILLKSVDSMCLIARTELRR